MQVRQLSILTYNVWVDNDYYPQNQSSLINYFIDSSSDIICLQEVTKQFFDLINTNEVLKSSYAYQPPKIIDESPCGGLLMVKKNLQPAFYRQVHLNHSRSCRYLDYASFTVEGSKLVVGSVHLESVFFTKRATDFKAEQLKQVCNKLTELTPDIMLIAGDMNFTSGSELDNEIAVITKLQLSDVWKEQHETMIEDENDQDYRDNHVTWDSVNNSNVEYKGEFHRPDRIFMRLFKPSPIKASKIERVKTEWSDHYGLTAVISFNN